MKSIHFKIRKKRKYVLFARANMGLYKNKSLEKVTTIICKHLSNLRGFIQMIYR